MNKALVKKFKEEFDFWLDGGSLSIGHLNEAGTYSWSTLVKEDWSFAPNKLYIVKNDDYVNYRRDIAEGKEVEYYDDISSNWSLFGSYNEFKSICKYRIKNAIEYKIGDWITVTNSLGFATNSRIKDEQQLKQATEESNVTKWKPVEGGMYVFWYSDKPNFYVVGTYSHTNSQGLYNLYNGGEYDNVAPCTIDMNSVYK